MKKTLRGIAAVLTSAIIGGAIPAITASAASSPFDASVISASNGAISSATVKSSESIGYNNEISYYNTTIKSTGTRKDTAKSASGAGSRHYAETFSNVSIATGGKLFVYSVPASNGLAFEDYTIDVIAKKFEEDHPEWKVAIVTNGSFFDRNISVGEPEDLYVEDGKTYKTYIEKGADGEDVFKVGRGMVGLKSDGSVIYHTIENGTSHYTGSTPYGIASKYTLEVLGENKNNSIYEYTLLQNGNVDYTSEPIFITPTMSAKDLRGAKVYKIKCSQYRRAHTGVNGREVGDQTYYFEGVIESIVSGTNSMLPSTGYVYVATYAPLEHLQVGVTVRGNRKLTGEWADVPYVFSYKQQILHEGSVLFSGAHQEAYGNAIHGSWDNTWSEDLSYASYGSNRTAVGFKADGTPVIITMPRHIYYESDGKTVKGEASATYSEMAWYMKSLGCVNAFMMDCGGSMGMYKKSTGSDTYEVACCEPLHTKPSRDVANALILAYPSGEDAKPTDDKLADPEFSSGYITVDMNTPWYSGVTKLRTTAPVKNSASDEFNEKGTLSKTNFSLVQSGLVYTFTPTATAYPSGYGAAYAYKKLGHTVEEGKKYVYCVKLSTVTSGKYTSFLFGEYPSNTDSSKMLNNFAVIGGAFSNNGDTEYSDVRVGVGRVENGTSDVQGSNTNINLYLETANNKKYSYYRIDIDGLNYTVKVKNASGTWVQIGDTYTLPAGTQLIMGCASWEANKNRAMSINDPVCVDITSLSDNIATAKALKAEDYIDNSFTAIAPALTKAEYSVQLTNQELIDYASDNLSSALKGLVKRVDIANANISEYEALDKTLYTSASLVRYTEAYERIVAAKNSGDLSNIEALAAEFAAARSALVASSVSVEISWQKMDFTYYAGEGKIWDPTTHTYVNSGESSWTANGNSNVINVENNSDTDITLDFKYTPKAGFEAVSGEFYSDGTLIGSNGLELSEGDSKSVTLNVKGDLPPTAEGGVSGATVTLTILPRTAQ